MDIGKKPTRTRAYITVVLIWLYAALFAGMPLFGIGKYVPEGLLTSCSFDYLSNDVGTKVFILVYFVGAWVYPLCIISFCYVAIVTSVYRVRLSVTADRGLKGSKGPKPRKETATDTHRATNRGSKKNHNIISVFIYLC